MLGGLKDVLAKAEAHADARKIEPPALLQARLFPDMFTLIRQVQIACDFASGVSARLAGVDVPSYEVNEQSFAELQARIGTTLSFIAGLTDAGVRKRAEAYPFWEQAQRLVEATLTADAVRDLHAGIDMALQRLRPLIQVN